MTCDMWLMKMIDVTAGEATAEDVAALEAHVATCTACANEYAAMRATTTHMARAAGSRAEANAATARLELYTPPHRLALRGWAVAAMVALAFAGGYAARTLSSTSPVPPAPVAAGDTRPTKSASTAGEYARLHATAPKLPAMARGLLSLARR